MEIWEVPIAVWVILNKPLSIMNIVLVFARKLESAYKKEARVFR